MCARCNGATTSVKMVTTHGCYVDEIVCTKMDTSLDVSFSAWGLGLQQPSGYWMVSFITTFLSNNKSAPAHNTTEQTIFRHFAIKKESPSNMVQGTFWKNLTKNHHFLMKKVMKLSRFLEDLGRFLAFIFLKSPYLANRF